MNQHDDVHDDQPDRRDPNHSNWDHDGDLRFDRLADGELAPDEYRALLATLDDEPSGWRRCTSLSR